MLKFLAWAGGLLLAALMVAAIGLMVWEPLAAQHGIAPTGDREYTAEIIRDEFGVPHIYGKTDADVAYGVAVAHAQDDFSTLQDVAAMTRGRYGAIAGQDGAQIDYVYHLLGARRTAEREFVKLPADTQALFEAYATGMNDYAAANPAQIKLGRLFPMNGTDVAAGFALRQPFFFGLNNVIAPLVAGEELRPDPGADLSGDLNSPGTESIMEAAPTTSANGRAALPIYLGEDGAMAGSNAWAISPEKSGDGVTRLVSNAHQPWRGGVAWYELVVESEEGWHFAGANFPGSPFPFLGHNEHLGWTNTVNQPDMVDVYELEMDDSGTRYRLDGEWRDLESEDVILPVKFGPLVLPIPRTVYRSVHGPVIKTETGPNAGTFAFRYGGIENIDNLDAYYRLNKATNLEQWQAILARMDIPSTNFIYGDEAGNIAFIYNAAIPDRPEFADRNPDWRRILPGNDSALIWNGPVGYDEIPKLINPASGWLFNANNNPFSAAGPGSDLDPADFSPLLGIETKSTNRARRAARLMSEADIIDRATLERIKYDTAYDREGYVAKMLDGVAALDLSGEKDLQLAQRLLGNWDLTQDNIGRGDALALLMIRPFMGADYQNTPIPDHREELERSTAHLLTHFGRLDPPMSDVLRLRQSAGPYSVDLPLDGGSDTLRASTLWDVDEDGRASVRHGDSFIQFVEWAPGQRVRSESIQPFGSATTRPGSPHYTDQSSLFIQHRLKPVHFWRNDVLKNAAGRKIVRHK